jgi:hypothetical protein
MREIEEILKGIGERNGLEIVLDENGACALELSDGRVVLLQERADVNELDFVATLGSVPDEARAEVFAELLSANFYWNETFGATISWNADLEEAVLIYPLPLAGTTPESVETIFTRFVELQAAWAKRFAGMVAAAQERASGDMEDDDEEDDVGASPADVGGNDHFVIHP